MTFWNLILLILLQRKIKYCWHPYRNSCMSSQKMDYYCYIRLIYYCNSHPHFFLFPFVTSFCAGKCYSCTDLERFCNQPCNIGFAVQNSIWWQRPLVKIEDASRKRAAKTFLGCLVDVFVSHSIANL